jgi:predicted Zn-dependent protease
VPNATRASLRRPVLLLLTLALALPVGCARNPVSGWPELVLVSTAREVEIGREEAAKVEKSIGYVPDRALQLWVQEIGKRLAVHSPRQDVEYHFYVVDMVEPNAFALPGGHVYVSRGLLALVNSEDELACVLGHEIGHVAARHAVQRATLATPFALVLGIPTAIVGSVSDVLGDVVGGVSSLATGVVIAPYSRQQERDADRIGLKLVAAAGWDPRAMSAFLHTLEREEALAAGGSRRPSFFDSHPSTPSRVRDTAEFAETLEVAPRDAIAADRPALLARLDGLLVGANPEQGVFEDELFMHPVLGFGIRFPAGWQTANTQSYVAASDPDDSKVLVVLQLAAEGSDPLAGAEADGLEEAAAERLEKVRIEDLEAVRFEGERRGSGFDLTWIAHRGHVYRVIASAPTAEFRRRRVMLQGVANSFHSLAEAERKRILEDRLRVARARSGESLAALVERTGSSWSAEKVAVANGRRVEEPLEAGELLKVPLLQRFRAS